MNADPATGGMALPRTGGVQAYRRVYSDLLTGISGGRFPVGHRLPSETRLSEHYGFSRITIRHALRLLQDQGLVDRCPGKGTFVRKPTPQKLPILNSDFSGSVRREAPGLCRELTQVHRGAPPRYVAETLGLLKGEFCLIARRLDSMDGQPLAFDRVCIPLAFARSVDGDMLARVDFLEVWLRAAGIRLCRVTETIEAVDPDQETRQRLLVPPHLPTLLVTDILYSEQGRALAVFESVYRGDLFRLVSSFVISEEADGMPGTGSAGQAIRALPGEAIHAS